jgi:hypothetical protein
MPGTRQPGTAASPTRSKSPLSRKLTYSMGSHIMRFRPRNAPRRGTRGPGTRGRQTGLMLALLACLATASGCSAHQAAPGGPRASATAAALLTSSVTSLRQGWDIGRAQQQLVARCMNDRGLRYYVSSLGPQPSAGTVTVAAVGKGRPHTYGVGLQPADGDGPGTGPGRRPGSDLPREDAYVASLPKAARTRYAEAFGGSTLPGTLTLPGGMRIGYATAGCLGQARRDLFGSVRAAMEDTYVPEDLGHMFAAFLPHNQPYESALRGWQGCMAKAGWDAVSPQAAIQAVEALAGRPGTTAAALNRRQIAEASADVSCDAGSHLRARTQAALAAFLRGQPGGVIALLQRTYQARQRATRVALRDLSG